MAMRWASLAAIPLLAAWGMPTARAGAPTVNISAVEAENCLLADVLKDKRSQLQELLRLARAQGLELTGPEIEALSLAPGRPRKLHEGHMVFNEFVEEPEEVHEKVETDEVHADTAETHEEVTDEVHAETDEEDEEVTDEVHTDEVHEGGKGHGGGDDAHGGHESEGVHFEPQDHDTSLMLLGLISFVMIMFYLTNWPDDDIRFYSWKIASTTISIFCAVLLFNGFNQLIRRSFEVQIDEEVQNGVVMTVLHFVHCFIYLALIHLATSFESGLMFSSPEDDAKLPDATWVYADALQCTNDEPVEETQICNIRAVARNDADATRSVIELSEGGGQMEVPVQKKQHKLIRRKRRTKALAMLLAHMAGFAAIFSGTSLQRVFRQKVHTGFSKVVCWIPLIINQLVIQLAFKISERVRDNHVRMREVKTMEKHWSDDDQKKKAKESLDLIKEMMTEEVVESENDVSSLSMSYLIVNVVRLLLTDELPDESAEEPKDWKPRWWQPLALYGVGLFLVLLAGAQAIAMQKLKWPALRKPTTLRILNTVLNATAMCFAWCVLWATHWAVEKACHDHGLHPHRILQKVIIAFVLTTFAAAMVFAVDKIDDTLEETLAARSAEQAAALQANEDQEPLAGSKGADEAQEEARSAHELAREMIRIVVTSLGILVGFSWEHCFDGGVESIAETTDESIKSVFQLVLGILVCVLVLPAWRKHILQKVMLMEEMRNKEEEDVRQPNHISSRVSAAGSDDK